MKADNFTLESYFRRIGYVGPVAADIVTLSTIMKCQLYSVPFENLDIQAGKTVSFEPEHIVSKILDRERGGYCYEVNGLFAMALEAMGVPYRFAGARPMFLDTRRPRTHMVILAYVEDEQWLFDLGFGNYGIRAPINLNNLDVDQVQDFDTFRLIRGDSEEYVLKARVEGEWVSQYSFDLSHQEWIDFMPVNYLNSTHPDAIFVRKLLIVLHDPKGRNILIGDTLKTIQAGSITKKHVASEDVAKVLVDVFGLTLPI